MKRLITFCKSHLILTGTLFFALTAGIPWIASAVRVAAADGEFSLTAVKEDREQSEKKEKTEKEKKDHKDSKEPKTVWRDAAGTWWLGTKGGLYESKAGAAFAKVSGGPELEVRAIAGKDGALWTAGKDGVWLRNAEGAWQKLREDDAFGVALTADGAVTVATKKAGAVFSTDGGKTWQPVPGAEGFKHMED